MRSTAPQRLAQLDEALWAWGEESFLPHGLAGEEDAARHPILLSASSEPPANGARVLFVIDGADASDWAQFERTFMVFDGRDEAALSWARAAWANAKAAGADLAYWKENAKGGWERQKQ